MMSAFHAGYALGGPFGAGLVARAGPIRAVAALCSIVSAIALVHVVFVTLPMWIGLRLVHGACFAVLVPIVESWINASTPRERRGSVLTLYGLTFLIGGALSQQLLNLAEPMGFALFALVSILAALALVPVTLATVSEPKGLAPSHMGLSELWRLSPLGVAGVVVSGASVAAFWGVGPAYAQGIGQSDASLSVFMSVTLGAVVLTQWPLGWLSDRVDRRLVVIGAFAAVTLASALLALSGPNLALLLALAALFGASVQPTYSLCVAHVNDRAPADRLVTVAGGLILAHGVAAAAGPVVAGTVMSAIGPGGLFAFTGALAGAFVLFGLFRLTRTRAVAAGDRDACADAPARPTRSGGSTRGGMGRRSSPRVATQPSSRPTLEPPQREKEHERDGGRDQDGAQTAEPVGEEQEHGE